MFGNPQKLLLPFVKKEQIAKNTWSFYFSRDNYPDFFPGQYNIVTIPDSDKNTPNLSHEFTICSSPTEMSFIMITTKIKVEHSVFKDKLLNLKSNSEVQFEGPKGGFYLRSEDKTSRVFISGGIGITPFHSMIKFAHDKKLKIPITLFASFSTKEEMIFFEELNEISNRNDYIKTVFLKERISEELIKKYAKDFQTPIFMLAGPPKMIDDITPILRSIGVEEENIKVDLFTGY